MYEYLRTIMILLVLAVSAIFAIFYIWKSINTVRHELWAVRLAERQFAAIVGLPFTALAAFCLVTILEAGYGPIEMEGFGFKFKGAAGPGILWIFTFLSITFSIKMVWIKEVRVAEDQEPGKTVPPAAAADPTRRETFTSRS